MAIKDFLLHKCPLLSRNAHIPAHVVLGVLLTLPVVCR